MATLKAPRKTTASAVALAVLVATPVGIAVAHPGFPTADVDLYQRAVWVTNEATGLIGLVNRQIRELTVSVPVSQSFDVMQSAGTVIEHDRQNNTAGLIDAAVQRTPAKTGVEPGSMLSLGASTLAVHDPVGGSLWALPARSGLEVEIDVQQATDVGRDALAVVSAEGTVFVASPDQSALLRLSGPGAQPERVGEMPPGELRAVTAVGERFVVATSNGSGTLITVVGGGSVDIPDAVVRLQQPGPATDTVVVATANRLLLAPVGGGEAIEVHSASGAAAAAPIEIAAPVVIADSAGACVYAAWASAAEFMRSCDGREREVENLVGATSADELVFRVNRDSVVLNNVGSGVIYLVQDEMTVIEADDWLAVAPPEEDDEAPESDDSTTQPTFDEILAERPETNTPPEAKNDDFGIRGDRTTILPVLENDIDLDGDVLTIASVTGLSPDVATLDIIDGGRALQITPISTDPVTRTFGYTVTDGREGGIAQAVVTVTVAPPEQNRTPEAQRVSQLSLEAGGTISYNVLADWRDPDGDDIYLTSASSTAGDSVRFSPDGLVTLTHSGTEPGERTLVFTVSDGSPDIAAHPVGELKIRIDAAGSLEPLTVPDFGQAFVGREVVLDPLSNDVPRSSREISLVSLEPLTPGASATPATDGSAYRFSASSEGVYYFVYVASTGAGKESSGVIRLDVIPDPDQPLPPIAVKDTAFLRPNEPLIVPVLLNDVSPSGAVLGIQSINVPTAEAERGLTVEVLGGAYLRIASTGALVDQVPIEYTISDGVTSASSRVTIVPVPELSTHQAPIARDDRVTVRAGDTASVNVLSNDLHPDGALMSLNPELVQGFDEESDGVVFVRGNTLLIQAPSEAGSYALVYRVDDAFSEYATARVIVTVTPDDPETNAAPLPATVTARVQAGGVVPIDTPTSGIDGDGDSVMLLSATGATLGRITAVGPAGFQYEAARDVGGTEVIRYTVQDAYGARGQGEVRIGVIPPPEFPLPPVAVDDSAEVRPGDTVVVRVLDNDSDPANAQLSLDPELIEVDTGITAEVIDDRFVAIVAGEEEGFFTLRYGITNTQGGASDAFVMVSVTPDALPQSPLAEDRVLTVTEILGFEQVEVDLLESAFNPDGAVDELTVEIVGPGLAAVTSVESGRATITLGERRQSVGFTLTSPVTGLSATAFVVVPAATSALPPSLKPEVEASPPTLAVGETATLQIRDLVDVPSGGQLVMIGPGASAGAASDEGSSEGIVPLSATSGLEQVTEVTATELRIRPTEEQRGGSQSITVLVTDGITDVGSGTVIPIPLVIGDPESRDIAPVFTPFEVLVEVGGPEADRDMRAATSHPNASIVAGMRYDAQLSGDTGVLRVAVNNGRITASAPFDGAEPGDEVVVDLVLQSDQLLTEPVTSRVIVRVVPSTRPLAQAVDDVEPEGRSSSTYVISPLDNDFNPFAADGRPLTITGAVIEGDPLGATVISTPSTVTVRTGPAKSGTVTVVYSVQDSSNEPSRSVQGRITVIVTSAPEPPTFVGAPQRGGSGTLSISFNPPSSWNGSPELSPAYVVTAYVGTSNTTVGSPRTDCTAGIPCTFNGLTNGTAYSFAVVARNGVGETASTRSATEVPYGTPSQPGTPSLSADGFAPTTLRASWGGVADTGGGAVRYQWKYVGAGDPAPAFSGFTNTSNQVIASGVGVGNYRIQVRACNAANLCGPWSAQSNQVSVINQPTWQVQVDNGDTCAQRSGGAPGLPGCVSPSNVWISANTTLTVSCYVSWSVNVLGSNPSIWYYISSGSYSSYYVAQRTLGPSWDAPGYVIPGMPSC